LRKAGIEVDPNLCIPLPRSKRVGFEAVLHFRSLPQKPTAAVCWNDLGAIGLMNGIARAGLVQGRDISVTGYDDLEEAS
ncbi:substrate-binding domain-containing protein, partial [Rhizobium ruizarguesonis]